MTLLPYRRRHKAATSKSCLRSLCPDCQPRPWSGFTLFSRQLRRFLYDDNPSPKEEAIAAEMTMIFLVGMGEGLKAAF